MRLMIGSAVGVTLAFVGWGAGLAGATNPPTVHMTAGPYHNGQTITIAVGPNHYFKPYQGIKLLECSDPGGSRRNLPVNVSSCDGNTIQGDSVLINKDGSFSEHEYQVYALPNKASLGEVSDAQPVCNKRHACVLYVGENQENFTWPKTFSRPFTVTSSGKGSK